MNLTDRPMRALLAAVLLVAAGHAAATQLQAAPAFEQHPGAAFPAAARFVDSRGHPVDRARLARDGKVIVLLPAYYRCDTLCGTVAHGALEALADTGLSPSAWQLVLFSIDPRDTAADALALQNVYVDYAMWARPEVFRAAPPALSLLTGSVPSARALADAIGFSWRDEAAQEGFAHPAGLVVLTPDGTVSRYLFGVRFAPAELRAAIVDAQAGKVGTPVERLLLACSHFDSMLVGNDGVVLGALRVVALVLTGVLALWIWRHRGTQRAR